MPLIRATSEIIDHWYSPELPTVPISVGVYSTGKNRNYRYDSRSLSNHGGSVMKNRVNIQ